MAGAVACDAVELGHPARICRHRRIHAFLLLRIDRRHSRGSPAGARAVAAGVDAAMPLHSRSCMRVPHPHVELIVKRSRRRLSGECFLRSARKRLYRKPTKSWEHPIRYTS